MIKVYNAEVVKEPSSATVTLYLVPLGDFNITPSDAVLNSNDPVPLTFPVTSSLKPESTDVPIKTLPLVDPNIAFPLTVSIDRKSAADVRVGLINKPLVVPFAPPD